MFCSFLFDFQKVIARHSPERVKRGNGENENIVCARSIESCIVCEAAAVVVGIFVGGWNLNTTQIIIVIVTIHSQHHRFLSCCSS
jgi:hypothetical protein